MSMIQIRNVPEDMHRQLKARAALEGLTLSEWALSELQRAVSAPSAQQLRDRIEKLGERPYRGETAAESTRAERDVA